MSPFLAKALTPAVGRVIPQKMQAKVSPGADAPETALMDWGNPRAFWSGVTILVKRVLHPNPVHLAGPEI